MAGKLAVHFTAPRPRGEVALWTFRIVPRSLHCAGAREPPPLAAEGTATQAQLSAPYEASPLHVRSASYLAGV